MGFDPARTTVVEDTVPRRPSRPAPPGCACSASPRFTTAEELEAAGAEAFDDMVRLPELLATSVHAHGHE